MAMATLMLVHSTQGAFTKHASTNCYAGHGGTAVFPDDHALPSKTVAECGAACTSNAACNAFVVEADTTTGNCWLRASVVLAECDQNSPYDTYDHSPPPPPLPPQPPRPAAHALVARINSKGINLGNVLEAPHEGDWAHKIERYFFSDLAARGFKAVRLGVRWDLHAGKSAPYAVNGTFLSRIETVVGWCVAAKLVCSINQHHDDWIGTGAHATARTARTDARAARGRCCGLRATRHTRTVDMSRAAQW
jgi:hypothetical protein